MLKGKKNFKSKLGIVVLCIVLFVAAILIFIRCGNTVRNPLNFWTLEAVQRHCPRDRLFPC